MSARLFPPPWLDFVRWCRARGLRALPAHPWTVAAYARWCEPRHRYPTIEARIRAIARIHLLKCASVPDRHPTVQRTLSLIEARERGRADRSDLFDPEVAAAAQGKASEPAKRTRNVKRLVATTGGDPAPRRRKRVGGELRATPKLVPRRPNGG